tara:strand:- start:548 stop:679 length:132 start_codon:yes stop_codon:yes gene_type:complete
LRNYYGKEQTIRQEEAFEQSYKAKQEGSSLGSYEDEQKDEFAP